MFQKRISNNKIFKKEVADKKHERHTHKNQKSRNKIRMYIK